YYTRDPQGFARDSKALAEAEAKRSAAEEQWLELEMLREELEGSGDIFWGGVPLPQATPKRFLRRLSRAFGLDDNILPLRIGHIAIGFCPVAVEGGPRQQHQRHRRRHQHKGQYQQLVYGRALSRHEEIEHRGHHDEYRAK